MFLNFSHSNSAVESNSSATMNLTHLLNNILKVLISDYFLISEFILEAFELNILLMISICALVFEFETAIYYFYKYIQMLMLNYFTAFITVDSHDDIHEQIIS